MFQSNAAIMLLSSPAEVCLPSAAAVVEVGRHALQPCAHLECLRLSEQHNGAVEQ